MSERTIFILGDRFGAYTSTLSMVAEGARKLGWKVQYFQRQELHGLVESGKITKETPVRGKVCDTRRALQLLGVKQPKNIDIPKCLRKFANRKVWESTLGETAHLMRTTKKHFAVKPLKVQKLFNGGVKDIHELRSYIRKYGENLPVLVSEEVDMGREHRFLFLNGEVYNAPFQHDWDKRGYLEVAMAVVKAWRGKPVAFAVDIANIEGKGPSLLEVNDGFSCCLFSGGRHYNHTKLAAEMTIARWQEMVG